MPEQQFRTSFIPKKPQAPILRRRESSVSIFFLAGLLIFLGALLLTVGLYFYRGLTRQAIADKGQQLDEARAAFDEPLIRELMRLDARIESAEIILDKHSALTSFFDLLEATTLQSVQFTHFSFSASEGSFSVRMQGVARSFSSVAFQSDVFGRNEFIKGPIFSNLDLDDDGNATFDFNATLDPTLLSYRAATGALLPQPQGELSPEEESESLFNEPEPLP